MLTNLKNIIVLSPHTDDGELVCGRAIAKLIDATDDFIFSLAKRRGFQIGLDYTEEFEENRLKN